MSGQHPGSASRRRAARGIRDLVAPFVEHSARIGSFTPTRPVTSCDGERTGPAREQVRRRKGWAAANVAVPY